jgi:rRNA-processing protein FCF1
MKYIFLDTNIFIHFQPYDQIPWREIVEDDYRLVVAPIVLDELDKHKTNQNKKIAARVKSVLPKMEKEQTNSESIINVNLPVPKDATFIQYELSRSQQDHALLSAILEFGVINGLENVVFVSHDTGARIRARQLGIYVIQLDDIYLLPEEENQEEKELKKLRKENTELKNNLPDVVLIFEDGGNFKKIEIKPIVLTEDEYCKIELEKIKELHKPFVTKEVIDEYSALGKGPVPLESLMANKKLLNSLSLWNEPTIEQKEKYNKELGKFYSEYENIFKDKYKWDKILSDVVKLDFAVSNNGTAPANDIDIFLIFPNTAKILLYSNFPKYEKPKPPYKPKHSGDFDMSFNAINFMCNPPAKEYIRVLDKSIIKNTIECCEVDTLADGSVKVHYKYSDSLKHNMDFSLEPIWTFSENNFKISYKLLISNYPKQVEGELNVIINIKR